MDLISITTAILMIHGAPQVASVSPDTGTAAGGERVLIAGQGLSGPVSVSFGGAPATVARVLSPELIEAVAPAGLPGKVDVCVSDPRGVTVLAGAYLYAGGDEAAESIVRFCYPEPGRTP